jgi:hypothetical protein
VKSDDIAWSRNLFAGMAEGGTWGIPRSGLVFQKRANKLVLIARMPHEAGMPMSAQELQESQDGDYAAVKEHFEAAGISVEKGN